MKKVKNKKQNKISILLVYILGALTTIALIVMVIALCIPKEPEKGEFVPPAFDSAAVAGMPEVPDGLGYSSPYQEGMGYRFSVCGNVKLEGKNAIVYLTNDSENEVYIKLRILDETGSILGETGLLKPGEYVRAVELDEVLTSGTKIALKIMSYEPDTYMSAGSAVLNTMIGGMLD